jgi:hypothetical protein
MATRVICDHCGHVISDKNPNVFSFGPRMIAQPIQYDPRQNAIVGVQAGGHSYTYSTPNPTVPIEDVDLCNACVPIWMSRVRNLTKASDPE